MKIIGKLIDTIRGVSNDNHAPLDDVLTRMEVYVNRDGHRRRLTYIRDMNRTLLFCEENGFVYSKITHDGVANVFYAGEPHEEDLVAKVS
jgi:hypothetical protein